MTQTIAEANKRLVLEAFDMLFNKRDYNAALHFWSPNYIQHSAHIPPGREALFKLIRSVPAALRYEAELILANDEFGIVHGRFSGTGQPRNWIAADTVHRRRLLVEHWDVLRDEATREESQSGAADVLHRVRALDATNRNAPQRPGAARIRPLRN